MYEVGSSGLPGPNVAVWVSYERGDIENVTVVPTGTVSVPGTMPRYSTPPFAADPR